MSDKQCSSCGGICNPSGCERENEPEALFTVNDNGLWEETDDPNGMPLYTAQAVQPLTDERISELDCVYLESNEYGSEWWVKGVKEFAHAVIAEFCRINGIGAPKGNV